MLPRRHRSSSQSQHSQHDTSGGEESLAALSDVATREWSNVSDTNYNNLPSSSSNASHPLLPSSSSSSSSIPVGGAQLQLQQQKPNKPSSVRFSQEVRFSKKPDFIIVGDDDVVGASTAATAVTEGIEGASSSSSSSLVVITPENTVSSSSSSSALVSVPPSILPTNVIPVTISGKQTSFPPLLTSDLTSTTNHDEGIQNSGVGGGGGGAGPPVWGGEAAINIMKRKESGVSITGNTHSHQSQPRLQGISHSHLPTTTTTTSATVDDEDEMRAIDEQLLRRPLARAHSPLRTTTSISSRRSSQNRLSRGSEADSTHQQEEESHQMVPHTDNKDTAGQRENVFKHHIHRVLNEAVMNGFDGRRGDKHNKHELTSSSTAAVTAAAAPHDAFSELYDADDDVEGDYEFQSRYGEDDDDDEEDDDGLQGIGEDDVDMDDSISVAYLKRRRLRSGSPSPESYSRGSIIISGGGGGGGGGDIGVFSEGERRDRQSHETSGYHSKANPHTVATYSIEDSSGTISNKHNTHLHHHVPESASTAVGNRRTEHRGGQRARRYPGEFRSASRTSGHEGSLSMRSTDEGETEKGGEKRTGRQNCTDVPVAAAGVIVVRRGLNVVDDTARREQRLRRNGMGRGYNKEEEGEEEEEDGDGHESVGTTRGALTAFVQQNAVKSSSSEKGRRRGGGGGGINVPSSRSEAGLSFVSFTEDNQHLHEHQSGGGGSASHYTHTSLEDQKSEKRSSPAHISLVSTTQTHHSRVARRSQGRPHAKSGETSVEEKYDFSDLASLAALSDEAYSQTVRWRDDDDDDDDDDEEEEEEEEEEKEEEKKEEKEVEGKHKHKKDEDMEHGKEDGNIRLKSTSPRFSSSFSSSSSLTLSSSSSLQVDPEFNRLQLESLRETLLRQQTQCLRDIQLLQDMRDSALQDPAAFKRNLLLEYLSLGNLRSGDDGGDSGNGSGSDSENTANKNRITTTSIPETKNAVFCDINALLDAAVQTSKQMLKANEASADHVSVNDRLPMENARRRASSRVKAVAATEVPTMKKKSLWRKRGNEEEVEGGDQGGVYNEDNNNNDKDDSYVPLFIRLVRTLDIPGDAMALMSGNSGTTGGVMKSGSRRSGETKLDLPSRILVARFPK